MKKKLVIMGAGKLATIIATCWKEGKMPAYDLIGIYSRTEEKAKLLAESVGTNYTTDKEEFLSWNADIVAEAASVQAVRDNVIDILKSNSDFVSLAIGAFADTDFYNEAMNVAQMMNRKIYNASGALGGFDVMQTAKLMSSIDSKIVSETGPQYLTKTPIYKPEMMNSDGTVEAFNGNAKKAIELLPSRVNVAVATSVATNGPLDTNVTIQSTPGFIGDTHTIYVKGEEVEAKISIYSKTSRIAGYSVVALLNNIASPVQFF